MDGLFDLTHNKTKRKNTLVLSPSQIMTGLPNSNQKVKKRKSNIIQSNLKEKPGSRRVSCNNFKKLKNGGSNQFGSEFGGLEFPMTNEITGLN